jgi:GGDEF domain-containing protein
MLGKENGPPKASGRRAAKPASSEKKLRETVNPGPPADSTHGQSEPPKTMPTCLDQKSGLFHSQHFWLSLNYEFRRMERAEKPLGLIVLKFAKPKDSDFIALAAFLKNATRPLDLAARLTGGEVAILIPEADRDRAVRLLELLGREYEPGGKLAGPMVLFGAAMARPFQGGGSDDLVNKARDSLGLAQEVAQRIISGTNPWTDVDTALAGPERDSLFNGFGILSLVVNSGRRP